MSVRSWVAAVLAAGLVVYGWGFCLPADARAQHNGFESGGYESGDDYESQPIRYQNNPKIKCLPFVKVSKQVPQAPRNLIRHQQHQRCIACHQSNSPVKGRGDRPKVMAATALVVNSFKTPIQYEAKGGNGQWQSYTLAPGQARRHTMNYKTRAQQKKRRSKPVWVRYEVNGHDHKQELKLVATPRKEFGNVYYFERQQDDVMLVSTPQKLFRPERKR